MRIPRQQNRRGIALVIVMIIIIVFAGMAFMLASSMSVETRLARNSSWDTELEWLGRSGIDLAKYFLAQTGQGGQAYDALNQRWAGGTGDTNQALADLSLTDNKLGHGTFSVKITDCDRKFNINLAAQAPDLLIQAFNLMGIDATEGPHLVAAIQDWIDRDSQITVGAQDTESPYYTTLSPPYEAKNGPIDDLTEMMRIKGVTEQMFWGSSGNTAGHRRRVISADRSDEPSYPIGFIDLFTATSGRLININTASPTVLQMIPDVDGNMAQAIVNWRAGPNGTEGDEDDVPFRSVGELQNVPGINPQMVQMFSRTFGTRSTTFEVEVDAQIDKAHRKYHALVRRVSLTQIVTLYMWWE